MGNKLTLEEVKQEFIKRGYEPLFNEYINCDTKMSAVNKDGYKIYSSLKKLQSGRPHIFHKTNIHTVENIKNYIKINNINAKLISEKYEGSNKNLIFECKCGRIFKATWDNFSRWNKHQCNECGYESSSVKELKYSIEDAKEIFKKNNLQPLFTKYKNTHSKLLGETIEGYKITTTIKNLNKNCRGDIFSVYNPYTIENIKLWLQINCINYELLSNKYYGKDKKLLWKCNKGHEFEMSWNDFQSGRRCIICNEYRGESQIRKYMDYNLIHCKQQYIFNNLITIKNGKLRFDFAIFKDKENTKLKCLIEYQGKQHFEPVDFAGKGKEWAKEQFKQNQYRDNIKRQYCKDNNIKLIEIPYWDFDNIEEILDRELNINLKEAI